MAGSTEFHRELLASWKALDDGFTYEMTFEREPLVIVRTAGEGAGRRLVGFAPAPAGLGERGRLRVTGAGETLHVVRLNEQEGGGFLFREDSIYGLDSEGRRLNRSPRSTSSEFDSISFFGFVFSPDYVSRHWLGQPWPEAWVHPGTAPTFKVTEKPPDKPDQRVFEVTMVARRQGKPDLIEHLTTRYERFGGLGLWIPMLIEQQSADRQTMKRVVLEWVEVSAGGKMVLVPKRFLFDRSARNPADGQFVPANRYAAVMDESTFRVRSRGADAGVFGVLDVEPAAATRPPTQPTQPPLGASRIYMIIFVCSVIAAAVLIGVRRLKRS
jgi:hypothetical protein